MVRLNNSLALSLSLHTELMFAVHQLKAKHQVFIDIADQNIYQNRPGTKAGLPTFLHLQLINFAHEPLRGEYQSLLHSVSLFSQNKLYWLWIHSDLTEPDKTMTSHCIVLWENAKTPVCKDPRTLYSRFTLKASTGHFSVFIKSKFSEKKKKQNNGLFFFMLAQIRVISLYNSCTIITY